jgi:sec-independent protein translocase protein TatA
MLTNVLAIGWTEGLIILGVVVLLFGARRIPELGKSLGEGIREFRKSSAGKDEEEKQDDEADKR